MHTKTEDRGGANSIATVLATLGTATLVALFYFRLFAGDPSTIPSALIGREAPEFSLPPVEGLKHADGTPVPGFSRADLGNGHVTVINVFGSWCVPCREERRSVGLRIA